MTGKLLIVHDSRTIRALVRRRILSEGADFVVDEASDAADASVRLCKERFDILVCADTLVDASGDEIVQMFQRASVESKLGYVFILSPLTAQSRRTQLENQGVRAFVQTPVEGPALVAAIGRVFEPRARRRDRRYNVPGGRAILQMGKALVEAEIVNISLSGMLCDMPLPEPAALFGITSADLAFPQKLGADRVEGIRALALRLQILARGAGQKPERIRCAWVFVQISEIGKQQLERILDRAELDGESQSVAPSSSVAPHREGMRQP